MAFDLQKQIPAQDPSARLQGLIELLSADLLSSIVQMAAAF